jgi:hypothetical protein
LLLAEADQSVTIIEKSRARVKKAVGGCNVLWELLIYLSVLFHLPVSINERIGEQSIG